MAHQTTSVWKCDLCPVEQESAGFPHGWFQFIGDNGALELDICWHCAMPIVDVYRKETMVGNFAIPKIDPGTNPSDLTPYITRLELPSELQASHEQRSSNSGNSTETTGSEILSSPCHGDAC